jgi:hypothetical protein
MPVTTKARHQSYPGHRGSARSRQMGPVARAIIAALLERGGIRRAALEGDVPVSVLEAALGGGLLTKQAAAGLARAFDTSRAFWDEIELRYREDQLRPKIYGKAARARRRRPAR